MATGGWGPGPGAGQPGGSPYGPDNGGNPYGPPAPNLYPNQNPYAHQNPYPTPYPHQNPYPNANPYPYGPQPGAPVPVARRRSCLWYVSPVFLVVAILRSAHRVATKLFVYESGDRIVDRAVDRVQVVRTVLGVLATLALILVYDVEKDRWGNAAEDGLGNALATPLILIVAGPLVILGFILYAPPHLRPHLRSRLSVPLKAVGWYVLTLVGLAVTLYAVSVFIKQEDRPHWQQVALAVIAMVAIFWGLPFLFLASLYSARSAFNTAHVHPMLPPVVTGVLVWVLALFNLIGDGLPAGPPVAQFCSLFGGPLSVTAVSAWEMRRLRTRFGVTVRG
ncbi:hypothetical protein [Streptomyces sp. NPDC054794]